ncbi:MAG: DNA topoisomerase VI subunit B [Candidatus Odinarchaeia archaeon]
MAYKSKGEIREGNIAEFMRKRTQLVGFSIERHKHTQYVAEFLDNSLDAIEAGHWRYRLFSELTKEIPKLKYKIKLSKNNNEKFNEQTILKRVNQILSPLGELIKKEPFAIIIMQRVEKPEILPDDIQGSDIEMYSFEAFDNGFGMNPIDVEKFGIYLASSKSEKLKQTRGSQGFGAPSAFSDAQNTTGRPITVISKHPKIKKAILQVFYTTSENKKKYLLGPELINAPFDHGTYVRLWYLNVKYIRGYADEYVRQTALLNSHINIIFVAPNGEIYVYPRKINEFPKEPIYTEPHPESTSIGDFQDALRNTHHTKLINFLMKSFCRIGRETAKQIINTANNLLRSKVLSPNTNVKSLTDNQINTLYKAFISQKYPAPPSETVVPVGEKILEDVIKKSLNAEFVTAVTRKPTSSKGLAFAVEAAIAYSPNNPDFLSTSGSSVLNRFINRTPKLRDNSDCAIWKAASSVNWKNYKIPQADNGLPKGPIKLFVNVSGPFVHVMFKAQSKQALAADDILVKEIKLTLEALGRKLRHYITKREVEKKKIERAKILLNYGKIFLNSLIEIEKTDPKIKEKPKYENLFNILEKLVSPNMNNVEKLITNVDLAETRKKVR